MLLSKYNKFIFSIFSESKNYLILTVYALKLRNEFISFMQIQYTRSDSSGNYMPAFSERTRLKVIDCSSWDIVFTDGKIIFKEDAIKIEYSSGMVMIYLNYTWDKNLTSPQTLLGKDITEGETVIWNSFNFRSIVRGNFITPLTSTEFINASGNIDLIKMNQIPFKVPINGLLWSRLHHNDIDLAYSFIFSQTIKSKSKLLILLDKKIVEFSDLDFQINKEKVSKRLSFKYPDDILLTARNKEYQVSVNVYGHSETSFIESYDNVDFLGKLFTGLFLWMSGSPKGLSLSAKADIVINNRLTKTEYKGIASISDYVSFIR